MLRVDRRNSLITWTRSFSNRSRDARPRSNQPSITATPISSGATLQIGNGGGTGSLTGNVTNNGLFIINRSNAYTFGGVISGTGSFVQTGAGTTTLTATNTFTAIAQGCNVTIPKDMNGNCTAGGTCQ